MHSYPAYWLLEADEALMHSYPAAWGSDAARSRWRPGLKRQRAQEERITQ